MIAELIYDESNSYEYLCSPQQFGNTAVFNEKRNDLAEIEEDIYKQQGRIIIGKLDCSSSVNSYCVAADLVPTGNGRYCADSTLTLKEITDRQTCKGTGASQNPFRCP